ncbi:putative sigma-54 modulation protein [Chitinophaga sp. CF118]|uniref:HPF/RaiA family ribosome-associated protein n=1 Tax=Chitinophaga sp. CF118 TaxID=1884367 RepID=UPI0008F30DAA|nr:HPF/RaiA family ribosome-associated protein [Chitinophaga sp. CF118]SFD21199.1 putative sigma-54 modulation protein [Chitinophaga sp. CF118]
MDIIIQSLGFKASNSIESFITEKLKTVKSDRIVRANVILFKGADSDPQNNFCEIRLEIPGHDLFVKKNSPWFETSVNECVDVLKQQVNKNKEKQVHNQQADVVKIQDAMIAENPDDKDVDLEDVVK